MSQKKRNVLLLSEGMSQVKDDPSPSPEEEKQPPPFNTKHIPVQVL